MTIQKISHTVLLYSKLGIPRPVVAELQLPDASAKAETILYSLQP